MEDLHYIYTPKLETAFMKSLEGVGNFDERVQAPPYVVYAQPKLQKRKSDAQITYHRFGKLRLPSTRVDGNTLSSEWLYSELDAFHDSESVLWSLEWSTTVRETKLQEKEKRRKSI